MTKISRYSIDTDVSGSDKWIGSDYTQAALEQAGYEVMNLLK